MDASTAALVIKIVNALLALVQSAPEIVAAASEVVKAIESGAPIAPERIAAIEALLERTHSALQAPMPDENAGVPS